MAGELTQEEKGKEKTPSLCAKEKTQPRKNMEERNTHAVRNGRRNQTLNGIQKSWEERQQPKLRVKPTASPNRGLKPCLFHIHSRNRALEATLPARCMHKTKGEPRLVREENDGKTVCEENRTSLYVRMEFPRPQS